MSRELGYLRVDAWPSLRLAQLNILWRQMTEQRLQRESWAATVRNCYNTHTRAYAYNY